MERVEKFFNCVDKNNWVFAIFVIIVFVVAVAFVWLISRIIKEWDKKGQLRIMLKNGGIRNRHFYLV
jgi:hypothetical protein